MACESDEFFVKAFEADSMDSWDRDFEASLSAQVESGEVCVAPCQHDDASGWHSLVGDEPDLATEKGQVWSGLGHRGPPAVKSRPDQFGVRGPRRFRILSVLGEGRHATVYRAFDPLLERHVALKLPRPGCNPRSAPTNDSWAKPGPWLDCDIPASCQFTRPAATAAGSTSPWRSLKARAWPIL